MFLRKPPDPFDHLLNILSQVLSEITVICVIPNVSVSGDLLLGQEIILAGLR